MIAETKDLNRCYGCFACANICPKNCIELEKDNEGFFMPYIDTQKCIQCGLCDKVCIIGKESKELVNHKKRPECFYGWLKDEKLRKRSASGGFSYAMSSQLIQNGGISFGVVGKWFEDVHHIAAKTLDDLEFICMSKNIQSRVGKIYAEAEKELKNGKNVFFTGTPCQIAALYSFLGKDYENLITADVICHGVPSQKVLLEYIKILEKENKKRVVNFGRSNMYQYIPVQYIVQFDDGSEKILMPSDSIYRKGFLSNLFQRKSCAQCPFSTLPRIGDFSMGDVMFRVDRAVEQIDPHNLGVSLILVNSEKGKKYFESIQNVFEAYPLDLERAITGNRWVSHGIEKNPLREEFFDNFRKNGLEASAYIIQQSYDNMNNKYKRERYTHYFKLLVHPKATWKKIKKRFKNRG